MNVFRRHALSLEAVTYDFGHLLRAADKRGVELLDIEPAGEQLGAFFGVDPAVIKVDVLLLTAEHEDQVQTLQIAVF